jgi:hypothetical protein
MSSEIDYKAIRQRVESRYGMRLGFAIHALVFMVAMVLAWFVFYSYFTTSGFFFDLALLGSAAWFAGDLSHGLVWLAHELKERAIDREIAIEREMVYRYGVKRKHKPASFYELTDDGELAEADMYDDEDAPPARLKR